MTKSTNIGIILTLLLCVCLSGCSSDSKYTELEQRVAYLESIMGVNESEESLDNTKLNGEASQNIISETSEKEDVNDNFVYFIDNLSAEEIVSECEFYFTDIPYKGEAYSEYVETFKVAPIDIQGIDTNRITYSFYRDEYRIPNADFIKKIEITGIVSQMDGTIGFGSSSTPHMTVYIELWIQDYDKASEVYDKLFDFLKPYYYVEEAFSDRRESTTWSSNGAIPVDPTNLSMGYYTKEFLKMTKQNGFFVINTELYTR